MHVSSSPDRPVQWPTVFAFAFALVSLSPVQYVTSPIGMQLALPAWCLQQTSDACLHAGSSILIPRKSHGWPVLRRSVMPAGPAVSHSSLRASQARELRDTITAAVHFWGMYLLRACNHQRWWVSNR
jgi:hypothetical protein